ncbi:MAG TPA: prepilin-type N-terminal cleavage/methylation domain-containing protein [Noviherbaspirillum sp.]|uniref:pilus assembly FimT family protein n=1 Tax=Noviherbaspirillum sp. TaxID=1926288 RepID=UPI002B47AE5F|nr:prepilin-type N-terminal cleavage/methylation domain-containing protein [Noviherbaspirillum sp.]HJV84117.1 prepilin-type N-terminal cleavage/methylation domain-containing protein [Noviherbaspirillum sp.]
MPSSRRDRSGFTLVELVATMVIIGVLAFVALPRFSLISTFQTEAFRDQVVAALRYGQKSAVSHRRLVCADVTSNSVSLRIASVNPASNCGSATLNGPDGQSPYASNSSALISAGTGTLYFQPSGTVTNGAGVTTDYSIAINGTDPVTVTGATGYVH